MGLEIGMYMDLELNLQYLPSEVISRVLLKTLPGSNIREKNIARYLDAVNGFLVQRSQPFEELREHYVSAVGIYTFVHPLLNLSFDDLSKTFVGILSRGPYRIKKPLDLFFREASAEETAEPDSCDLVEITQNLINSSGLKRNKKLQQCIQHEITQTCEQLGKTYTRDDHFAFVGYFDICSPLFDVDMSDNIIADMDEYLKEKFGVFLFQMPSFFRGDDYS